MSDTILIHVKAGQLMTADSYALKEYGMPDGFKVASEMTLAEWIMALENANQRLEEQED